MQRKRGMVFVHGIVGNNRIFDFLKPFVPEDYEVRYVVLKGHGGDALGFSRASMSAWRAQVGEAIARMDQRCDEVIGVGHSMGCLLLMEHAMGDGLAALVLLNPPLRISLRTSMLRNVLKVTTGDIHNDPVARAAMDAYGISMDFNPLHYYGWPDRYIELFREIARVRKDILPRIECPTLSILSARDEVVSLSSAKELEKLHNGTIVILSESAHYYYSPEDRERICTEFTKQF